jgi:Flp pilus assembly protein TadD
VSTTGFAHQLSFRHRALRASAARWVLIAALGSAIAGCSNNSGVFSSFGHPTGATPSTANQPTNPLQDGDAARDKGDLDTAAADYAKATAADPKSVEAQLRLGAVDLARKDSDGAFAAYRTAQSLSPKDPEAAFRLGEIELTRGDAKAASAAFAIALQTRTNDAKLYNAMGVALTMQGQFDDAKVNYDKGLAIEPTYAALRNNYGLMQLQSGDLSGAMATFTSLVSSPQANDRYRLNRALVELALGQTAAARADAPNIDDPGLRQALATYLAPPSDIAASSPKNADPAFAGRNDVGSPSVHLAVDPQPPAAGLSDKPAKAAGPVAELTQPTKP